MMVDGTAVIAEMQQGHRGSDASRPARIACSCVTFMLHGLQAEGIVNKVKQAVGLGTEKAEDAKQYAADAANTASNKVRLDRTPELTDSAKQLQQRSPVCSSVSFGLIPPAP
jgi:hypothetical protein